MNYETMCEEVKGQIPVLQQASVLLSDQTMGQQIKTLQRDMEADLYHVVVLGEFNRGKSTLLNALLGQDLLPMDVTPTTAKLHVVRYSERPLLRVCREGGEVQESELSREALSHFALDAASARQDIEYLEVGVPSPLLLGGVVYVDTPGVSDMNTTAAEITYRFVPRADAVIFLVDATEPVRRTERDFLESAVLSSGIERLIFVANRADMIDADEREHLVRDVHSRLATALGREGFVVFPLSARQALRAVLSGDEAQLRDSGLPSLAHALAELQKSGPGSLAKSKRFAHRAAAMVRGARAGLNSVQQLSQESDDSLRQRLHELEAAIEARSEQRRVLDDYVRDRQNEIVAMVRKSLEKSGERLREEAEELVATFRGTDFKDFVETRIPSLVKRRCKEWVELYVGSIRSLLRQMDREIAVALSREFQARLPSLVTAFSELEETSAGRLSLLADDVSGSRMTAGLIVGGAAALLMVLGGPVLLPVLTLAGYPPLHEQLLKKNLIQAKEKLLPELRRVLTKTLDGFSDSVAGAVAEDIEAIRVAAQQCHDSLFASMKQMIEREMDERQQNLAGSQEQRAQRQVLDARLVEAQDGLEVLLSASGGSTQELQGNG